jgi:hypothetical protein
MAGIKMRCAVIQRCRGQRLQHFGECADRVVRPVWIGNMALFALNFEISRQRPTPPDFDHITKLTSIGWLADNAEIELFALIFRPLQQLHRTVDCRAFFIPGNQKRNPALKTMDCQTKTARLPPPYRQRHLSYRPHRDHKACHLQPHH